MNQSVLALLSKVLLTTIVLIAANPGVSSAETMTPADASVDASVDTSVSNSLTQPAQDKQLTEVKGQLKDDDRKDQDREDKKDQDDDDKKAVEKLPKSCSKAVLGDVSKRRGGDAASYRIVKVKKQVWSDRCLGLGQPGVNCTQAAVPGYLVLVEQNQQYWVYRTDETGSMVTWDEAATQSYMAQATTQVVEQRSVVTRTQTSQTTQVQSQRMQFSQAIATMVFQSIAERWQVQASSLRVLEAKQETWSDGCLGLPSTGACTQAEVSGWRVVVASGDRAWVYRTDASGSLVAFDESATQTLMAQRTTQTTQVSFRDVSSDFWASTFIAELAKLQIVEGFPDGTFRPNEIVTRAQFAAMLRKAFDKAKVREAIAFRDVSSEYWAYAAIQEAYEMGFLGATANSEFKPTLRLDRADILTALFRGLGLSSSSSTQQILTVYRDAASIPVDLRTVIATLTEQGMVVNYPDSTRLDLNRTATRAEVCAILYQALVKTGKVSSISSPYVVKTSESRATTAPATTPVKERRHCNQGIGNGSEGCDPGNSHPHGGSNDEGGRTPGGRNK